MVPENVGIAVEIFILSHLGTEIQVHLVWRPPSWNLDFRVHQIALTANPLESECSDMRRSRCIFNPTCHTSENTAVVM
jgi:hypothetical protein